MRSWMRTHAQTCHYDKRRPFLATAENATLNGHKRHRDHDPRRELPTASYSRQSQCRYRSRRPTWDSAALSSLTPRPQEGPLTLVQSYEPNACAPTTPYKDCGQAAGRVVWPNCRPTYSVKPLNRQARGQTEESFSNRAWQSCRRWRRCIVCRGHRCIRQTDKASNSIRAAEERHFEIGQVSLLLNSQRSTRHV